LGDHIQKKTVLFAGKTLQSKIIERQRKGRRTTKAPGEKRPYFPSSQVQGANRKGPIHQPEKLLGQDPSFVEPVTHRKVKGYDPKKERIEKKGKSESRATFPPREIKFFGLKRPGVSNNLLREGNGK